MDFWQTVLVLFRRWYVTVPAFFATLGLAAAAYSLVPTQYESGSILVLTTPLSGGTISTEPGLPSSTTNPLMNFDPSLGLAASVVIQQLSSAETASALGVVPGGATTYEVNNGTSNPELLQSGPFIFVDGKGPSPQAAREITSKVSAMAATVLAQRQDQLHAPAATDIELRTVVAPTVGQAMRGSPKRAAAAVGALAALGSLAAAYGFESMAFHRRRRRAEKARATQLGHATITPAATREGLAVDVSGNGALVRSSSAPEER